MNQHTITLVIEGTYPWYRGGVSEWVYQYIKAFPELMFDIVQVATDEYLHRDIREALYPVPGQVRSFVRIPPPDLTTDWNSESVRWFREQRDRCEQTFKKADIIHIANTGFAGWMGMHMAREFGKPLVLTEHALYWKEVDLGAVALECGYKVPAQTRKKEEMVRLFKRLARQIYAQADEVVSVSKCNIACQKRAGAVNARYIPNGVDAGWLSSQKIRSKTLTVGWIGRCAEMKNPLKFFDLVRAFRSLGDIHVEYIMMLCDANEPELKTKVRASAADCPEVRVIWNRPSKQYLPGMDALCITSHNESQPLVLFEALSQRVLPVGWQAGDVTPEFGLIFNKASTPARVAGAVRELWETPVKWKNEVDRRFKMVEEHHVWPKIFDRYRTFFAPYFNKNS